MKWDIWTSVAKVSTDTDRAYALVNAGTHWCLRLMLLSLAPTVLLASTGMWLAMYGVKPSFLGYASAVGTVLTVLFMLAGLGCGIVRAILPEPPDGHRVL